MTMTDSSTVTIAFLTALISGLKKNQPNGSFVIAGVTYTTAQLVKTIQTVLTAMTAVPPAKSQYADAVKASRAAQSQSRELLLGLKQLLLVENKGNSTLLTDYGLAQPKSGGATSPKVGVLPTSVCPSLSIRRGGAVLLPPRRVAI
jgi:hypothetical protein